MTPISAVKVLIVDDDEDLLEMVTLMLTANQMQVTGLTTVSGLFEILQADPPDVLLMDIFLGDSDGRQICKTLKNSGSYAGFPIFLYSAGDISTASINESTADYFFRKPFEMHQLVSRIHQTMQK